MGVEQAKGTRENEEASKQTNRNKSNKTKKSNKQQQQQKEKKKKWLGDKQQLTKKENALKMKYVTIHCPCPPVILLRMTLNSHTVI